MMGPSHAVTGAAGWLALTGPLADLAGVYVGPQVQLVGALTTAGAALISDWDHPRATIATALPPLSTVLARFIRRAAGGHRRGTHSFVGLAAFTAVTWVLTPLTVTVGSVTFSAGQGVVAAFLAAVAARILRVAPGPVTGWAVGLAAGALAGTTAPGATWLTVSVALGVGLHIVGDMLTTRGVALLWPALPDPPVPTPFWLPGGRFRLPLLGRAGSWREWVVATACTVYVVGAVSAVVRALLAAADPAAWPLPGPFA
ncbi:metal-dependent hydrolase [Micrococcus porci]|uniref:metal-dependent hydrolase n=1 Tax=Micrococcus porci TaxID=2856555 RepID=UPI001CCBED75|nr:metal-dependent hydrolase [Micrococcus porci]UBH24248.1 metal-dependent hydrolase [Micrococcus porci]